MVGRRIATAAARIRAEFDEEQQQRMINAAIGTAVMVCTAAAVGFVLVVLALGLKAFGAWL